MSEAKKRPGRKKEKFGAPIPTILTPTGEMSLAEAAQLEREGRYPGREVKCPGGAGRLSR